MKRILEHIAEREADFARHPFFARLERDQPFQELAPLATGLAFWVLTFHDLLHLLEAHASQDELGRIIRHHVHEEAGHDRWYLDDLETLGLAVPASLDLFGATHAPCRLAAYALMAEAFRAEHDLERIALVLALESTGHVFFQRSAAYRGFPSLPRPLRFFSGYHLEVEEGHELLEARMRRFLATQTLEDLAAARIRAACDRCYAAFDQMFDGLEAAVAAPYRSCPSEASRPLRPAPRTYGPTSA